MTISDSGLPAPFPPGFTSAIQEAMEVERQQEHARAVLGDPTLWRGDCSCTVLRQDWAAAMFTPPTDTGGGTYTPYDRERHWPIADLNDDPADWTRECDRGGCAYGACRAPGTMVGCGGCCYCLSGCQVDYERHAGAPYVWEGDQG